MSQMKATIQAEETNVFPRFLDLAYPNIEKGKGVWLETTDGKRILDACSGGAMVACLGPVSYTHLTLPTNREV